MSTASQQPGMMPGQKPYTADELKRLHALVSAAADGDPGEEGEEVYLREQPATPPATTAQPVRVLRVNCRRFEADGCVYWDHVAQCSDGSAKLICTPTDPMSNDELAALLATRPELFEEVGE